VQILPAPGTSPMASAPPIATVETDEAPPQSETANPAATVDEEPPGPAAS
jgi:hypothetical protein